jgi:DNA-binding NarL/FixJ family response regulator
VEGDFTLGFAAEASDRELLSPWFAARSALAFARSDDRDWIGFKRAGPKTDPAGGRMTLSFATAAFEAWPPPGANTESDHGRLVLIEPRKLVRETLVYALGAALRGTRVEGCACVEYVEPGPAQLLLIGVDPVQDVDPESLRANFAMLRDACGEAPIGAILRHEDAALARALGAMGVVGIIQPSFTLAVAIAAIRLMLVGGYCLPPDPPPRENGPTALPPPTEPIEFAQVADTSYPSDEHTDYEHGLTAREFDVLKCLREGRQNKIIAFELGISESTVKVHLRNIMKKLRVTNRTQAALGGMMPQ